MMVIRVLLFLLCIILTPDFAKAAELKVGVIDIKPWGYKDSNSSPSGQHIDTLDELAERLGISFEYQILPLARIKKLLEVGQIDMTIIFKRDNLKNIVDFIGMVKPYNYYLVGKRGQKFDDKKIKNLNNVGHIIGEADVVKKCFSDQYNSKARLYSTKSYGNLLKMLERNRIEAATIPSKGLKAYLDGIKADASLINRLFILCRNEAFLQISKKSPHYDQKLIETMRMTLKKMRADGTIESIAAKYDEVKN
ncbi:exported hypothetical protein [Candidatus Terasakiella magnetica]|uniref:Solute-binding protein family 3/N-terminal domain-containing protein n=2 Tax=Candidatus Terasakiella magnetica TaxID=1867952 RepID=A0A1C3RIA5_9PROT|nr:exported hypothetical protein [Candidatus Terasakiella magnetica]